MNADPMQRRIVDNALSRCWVGGYKSLAVFAPDRSRTRFAINGRKF